MVTRMWNSSLYLEDQKFLHLPCSVYAISCFCDTVLNTDKNSINGSPIIIQHKQSGKSDVKEIISLNGRRNALNKLYVRQNLLQLCIQGLPSSVKPQDSLGRRLNHGVSSNHQFFHPSTFPKYSTIMVNGWCNHWRLHVIHMLLWWQNLLLPAGGGRSAMAGI